MHYEQDFAVHVGRELDRIVRAKLEAQQDWAAMEIAAGDSAE
jgi:hypothetical protein